MMYVTTITDLHFGMIRSHDTHTDTGHGLSCLQPPNDCFCFVEECMTTPFSLNKRKNDTKVSQCAVDKQCTDPRSHHVGLRLY